MLVRSNYVTQSEAAFEYKSQNSIAETRYLYVPYYAVSDSLVSVTDSELRTYLNNNEDEFKVEESRDLKYVQFPIEPSPEDSSYFFDEIKGV